MSYSIPLQCVGATLLEEILKKFKVTSTEKDFKKRRAIVKELRLMDEWPRIYKELCNEGHWDERRSRRKRSRKNNNSKSSLIQNNSSTDELMCPTFQGNHLSIDHDYLDGGDLGYFIPKTINRPNLEECQTNLNNSKMLSVNKCVLQNQPQQSETKQKSNGRKKKEKEKNVKEKGKDNRRTKNNSMGRLIIEEDQSELNNYNVGSKNFQKVQPFQTKEIEIVENKSEKLNKENIILQNQRDINHFAQAQEELKCEIHDLFIFIKENFESIHQTQNQLFELISKKQNDDKKVYHQNTAILDPTFIENLTNAALQTTHIMRKLVLLKIKAMDGLGKVRLPQPNEARKVSRCLQVRLCKQKSRLLQYFEQQIFTKPFLIENSNERKQFFNKIPNRFFDPVYNEMSYSVKMKCLNSWLTDFLTMRVLHENEKVAQNSCENSKI